MVLFKHKFYTIVFFYIFLFGSLGGVYSGIVGEIDDGGESRQTIEEKNVNGEGIAQQISSEIGERIVPKAQASAPIEEFVLVIPSIGLEQEVVENVNPADPRDYMSVLNASIAHGKYTRMPDGALTDGNVYLFAHREWVYQGHDAGFFSRLGELENGDNAIIKYNGKEYLYQFRSKRLVDVKDVSVYTSEAPSPTLTLQTCEGSEKRLIVSFDFVSAE